IECSNTQRQKRCEEERDDGKRPLAAFHGSTPVRSKKARPPSLRFFSPDNSHKRSGSCPFRRCCKSIFVASDQVSTSKKATQRERQHDSSYSVVKLKQDFTEEVAADAEHCGPDDATTGIGDQKRAPGHPVQSSEKCRQHAQ